MTGPPKREPEQLEMHDLLFGPVRTGKTTTQAAQPEQSPTARRFAELSVAHEALADLERKTAAKTGRTTKWGAA